MAKTYSDFQEWLKESRDIDDTWREKAKENLRFYRGDQWDAADLEVLKKEKRPALTINKIFPLMNFLEGFHIQNAQDIQVVNRKGSTKAEAEVLTECIAHLMDSNEGEEETTEIFKDGVKTGRGFLTGVTDYTQDPINGDLKLQRTNPLDIYPDPKHLRYDLEDCEYVIRTQWYTLEKLRTEYPDKDKELKEGSMGLDSADLKNIRFRGGEQGKYEEAVGSIGSLHRSQVLVLTTWYKTDRPVWYVVLGDMVMPAYSQDEVKSILQIAMERGLPVNDAQVIRRSENVLNLAVSCGNIVLQDEERPLGDFNQYPIVGFFPYRLDRNEDDEKEDNTLGVIDNLKDLQREVNKRRSQQLNIVNTLAHSGWKNKKQGGAKKKDLESFGSTPGAVIEYEDTEPKEITPKSIPQGHVLEEEKAATDMKETASVNPDMLGYRGERGEPGVVLQMRQQQGQVALEGLIRNMRRTQKILGRKQVGLITKSGLYTPNEVLNIVDLPADPALAEGKVRAVQSLFTNQTTKRFDVIVITRPSSPSQRIWNFYALSEVAKAGMPIPPDVLVEAADLPYKEKILQYIESVQQAQMGGGNMPPAPDVMKILSGGG